MHGDHDGAVVAEVSVNDVRRQSSVRPGRYFVRGRGRDHLLEGAVEIGAGQVLFVADGWLERIAYDRLVRKGGGVLGSVHAVVAGARLRTALDNASGPCVGGHVGYSIAYPALDLGARIGWCRAALRSELLRADVDELDLELRLGRSFDLPVVTLSPHINFGGAVFRQAFEPMPGGVASERTSAAGHLGAGLAVSFALPAGFLLAAPVTAQTDLYRQHDEGGALAPAFAVRSSLALGWRFGR